MKNANIIAALVLSGMTAVATAQTNNPPNGGNGQSSGERRGPPPQAIEACQGKASGASCSFVGRYNKERTGICFSPNADHPLACRPEHGESHQEGQGKDGHE